MPLTPDLNAIATAEVANLVYLSIHTADPGTTGVNEATGGSPAYARVGPLSWGTASGGVSTATQVSVNVPAGTYPYFGYWSAATGGTFHGGNPLGTSQTLSGQGVIQVVPKVTATVS